MATTPQTGVNSITQTPAKAANSVSNVVSNTSSEVSGVVSSGAAAVGSSITSVEDMASKGISAVVSPIGTVVTSAKKMAGDALNSVTNFLGKEADAAAGDVSSTLGGLFGNKKDNTSLKTGTPDSVKSSTTTGTLANGLYKTNNVYSQMTPIDLNNPLPQLTTGGANTTTLAGRLGMSINDAESSILGAASSFTHGSLVQGIGSGVSSGMSDLNGLIDLAHTTTSDVHAVMSVPSVLKAKAIGDWSQMVSGFARSVTGLTTGLDSFYNTGYSAITGPDGEPLSGVDGSVPGSMMNSLYSTVNSQGCVDVSAPSFYEYGAKESLKDATLNLAYVFNLKDLLKQMTSCSNYNRTIQATGSALFNSDFASSPSKAAIIGDVLDPSTTTLPQSQITGAISNQSVTSDDVSAVKSTFDRFGVDGNSLYESDSNYGKLSSAAGVPVYDVSQINKSTPAMVSALTGNNSLTLPRMDSNTVTL